MSSAATRTPSRVNADAGAGAQNQIATDELIPLLKDVYHRTRQELEQTKAALDEVRESASSRITALEDENAQLRAEVERWNWDMRLARDALYGGDRDTLGGTMVGVGASRDGAETSKSAPTACSKCRDAAQQRAESEKQVEMYKAAAKELVSGNKDVNSRLRDAETKVSDLESQLSEKDAEIEDLNDARTKQIAEYDLAISILQEKYQVVKEKKLALKTRISELTADTSGEGSRHLEDALEGANVKCIDLEKQLEVFMNPVPKPRYTAENNLLDALPAVKGLPCKHSELKRTKRKTLDLIARDLSILVVKSDDCILGQARPEHFIYLQSPFVVARREGGKWDLVDTTKPKSPGETVHLWVNLPGRLVYYGKYKPFAVDVDLKGLGKSTQKILDRLVDLTLPDQDVVSPLVRMMVQRMYEERHIVPLTTGFKCIRFDKDVYRRSYEDPEPEPASATVRISTSKDPKASASVAQTKKAPSRTPKRPASSGPSTLRPHKKPKLK